MEAPSRSPSDDMSHAPSPHSPAVYHWGPLTYELPLLLSPHFQFQYQFLIFLIDLVVPSLHKLISFIDSSGMYPIVFLWFRSRTWTIFPSCPPVPKDPPSSGWNLAWTSSPYPSPLRPLLTASFQLVLALLNRSLTPSSSDLSLNNLALEDGKALPSIPASS